MKIQKILKYLSFILALLFFIFGLKTINVKLMVASFVLTIIGVLFTWSGRFTDPD